MGFFGVCLLRPKPLDDGELSRGVGLDGSILISMWECWKAPSVAPECSSWAAKGNLCQPFPGGEGP